MLSVVRRRVIRREALGLILWMGAVVVVYGTLALPFALHLGLIFLWLAGSGLTIVRMSRANLRDTEEVFQERLNGALRAHEDIITRMAMYSEAKDALTGEHLHRVRETATLVAGELGLEIEEARAIGRAAVAHDLGKIGIPDAILDEPGKLTADEFETIKKHTEIGERVLGQSPLFELERQAARYHHERWDGSGYPDGLTGTNIPLVARITSVADVFDTLVTRRPYKEPWSEGVAATYLKENAGTDFDPDVVAAFLRLLERGEIRGHRPPRRVDLSPPVREPVRETVAALAAR
ncbi:MAG: HD-GYP domain-containing protein [Chloroflexi bacterium]|nr:HD-GYP domain-containing protein [Chloroflexota bacterium]